MFERRFLKFTMPRIENTVNLLHVWTMSSLVVHRYWKVGKLGFLKSKLILDFSPGYL
jgi:hypothetical protein